MTVSGLTRCVPTLDATYERRHVTTVALMYLLQRRVGNVAAAAALAVWSCATVAAALANLCAVTV